MNLIKLIAATSLLFVAKLSETTAEEDTSLRVTNGDDFDTTPILANEFDYQSEQEFDYDEDQDLDDRRHLDHNGAHGRLLDHQVSDIPEGSEPCDKHGRRSLKVIGPDTRVAYNPYDRQRGVGLLQTLTQNCTATLIGREYIATAARCVFTDTVVNGKKTRSIPANLYNTAVFHFGFNNGKPTKFNSALRKVYVDPAYAKMSATADQNNVAVISLKEALGQVTGYMQVTPASNYNNLGVNAVGFFFNSNTTAGADYCCKIVASINAGQVKHICDVSSYGGLGAPLYQQIVKNGPNGGQTISYALVAMHNGEMPIQPFNLAAKASVIQDLLDVARKDNKPVAPPYTGEGWVTTKHSEIDCPKAPTKKPTKKSTRKPTGAPTPGTIITETTQSPVPAPTSTPPSNSPVVPPSHSPVVPPSHSPVVPPSNSPVVPPSNSPVVPPSNSPVVPPSNSPVVPPSNSPVVPPSNSPVVPPSNSPVVPPSHSPVVPPSNSPVVPPSNSPVVPPSKSPTSQPSSASPTLPDCPPQQVRCNDKKNPKFGECIPLTKSPTPPTLAPTLLPTTLFPTPQPPTSKSPTTKAPTLQPVTKSPTTKAPTTKTPTLPDCPTGKTRCNDQNSPHYGNCIDPTPSPTIVTAFPTKQPTWYWRSLSEVLGYETAENIAIEATENEAPKTRLRARM